MLAAGRQTFPRQKRDFGNNPTRADTCRETPASSFFPVGFLGSHCEKKCRFIPSLSGCKKRHMPLTHSSAEIFNTKKTVSFFMSDDDISFLCTHKNIFFYDPHALSKKYLCVSAMEHGLCKIANFFSSWKQALSCSLPAEKIFFNNTAGLYG